jgi:hypothetical protein
MSRHSVLRTVRRVVGEPPTARDLGLRVAVALAVSSVLAVSSASAVTPQLSFSVAVSPYTGGTATAPVTLTLHTTTTPNMSEPSFATSHMRFDLDPSIVTGFQPPAAACTDAQVMADATPCATVGDGTMSFSVLGLTQNVTVKAFQSTDPQALLLRLDGDAPLRVHEVMTMQRTVMPSGASRFDIDVPPSLQQPAPGAYATPTDFNLALRWTIALVGCPASPLSFATDSHYSDGTSKSVIAQTACEVGVPGPPNTAPPKITGTTVVGETLSSSSGNWYGASPISFGYQWERCNPSCSAIAGATSSSYTLAAADKGAKIAATVTAANDSGSTQATSDQVGPVVPSSRQVKAALVKALAATGPAARLGQLLKHGGLVASINAPSAGRLLISWYLVPKGAHLTKAKQPTLVATVRAALKQAGKAKVKIALTRKGRKLLRSATRIKLTAKGSFTPTGASTTTTTRAITLKR